MNVASGVEQILEAALHKTAAVWPPSSRLRPNQTRHVGCCWRNKDEITFDDLLWTPTYGRASVGWPAGTYIHHFADIGCGLEYLPRALDDKYGWCVCIREREREREREKVGERERKGERERENRGMQCCYRDLMMMMMMMIELWHKN